MAKSCCWWRTISDTTMGWGWLGGSCAEKAQATPGWPWPSSVLAVEKANDTLGCIRRSVTCRSRRWFFFSTQPHSEYCVYFWALSPLLSSCRDFLFPFVTFLLLRSFKFCLFTAHFWKGNHPLRLASISLDQVPRRARDCRAAETPAMAAEFSGTGAVCWCVCAPAATLCGQTLLLFQGRVIHLHPPDETVLWFILKLFWIRLVNFCLDF